MNVTKVIVNNVAPKDRGVCGEFTVTLDNVLCIHRILVVNGEKGLFVTFPNAGAVKHGIQPRRYMDIVHPTDNSLRQHIQDEVLKCYSQEVCKISD